MCRQFMSRPEVTQVLYELSLCGCRQIKTNDMQTIYEVNDQLSLHYQDIIVNLVFYENNKT